MNKKLCPPITQVLNILVRKWIRLIKHLKYEIKIKEIKALLIWIRLTIKKYEIIKNTILPPQLGQSYLTR